MNEKNRVLFTRRSRHHARALLFFFFLLLITAYAFATPQAPANSLSDQLKAPPAFIPEFMAEKENAATLYTDGIYALYAAEKANRSHTKPASATTSRATSSNWSLEIETRNSPVLEEHGNAQRHESLGGLIKGTIPF